MARIEQDPNLEVRPDHAGPHYTAVRNQLVGAGLTEDQAIASLNESWDLGHQERLAEWNTQVETERQAREDDERRALEQAEEARKKQEEEEERERREIEKKRPQMNDFNETQMVDDVVSLRPSPYATRKLEDFEYVELYYFTPEGCRDAHENHRTQHEESLGLANVEGVLSFRPLAAVKASKNVVQDSDLSWRQMSMAKSSMIDFLQTNTRWPSKHIQALALFFVRLETHPMRTQPYGEEILLRYQARVRRDWHDRLKRGTGAFNISLINEIQLQAISNEVWQQRKQSDEAEVSFFCSSRYCSQN